MCARWLLWRNPSRCQRELSRTLDTLSEQARVSGIFRAWTRAYTRPRSAQVPLPDPRSNQVEDWPITKHSWPGICFLRCRVRRSHWLAHASLCRSGQGEDSYYSTNLRHVLRVCSSKRCWCCKMPTRVDRCTRRRRREGPFLFTSGWGMSFLPFF